MRRLATFPKWLRIPVLLLAWAIQAYLLAQVALLALYGISAGIAIAVGMNASENVMIGLALASLLIGAAVTVKWPLLRRMTG